MWGIFRVLIVEAEIKIIICHDHEFRLDIRMCIQVWKGLGAVIAIPHVDGTVIDEDHETWSKAE